MLEFDLTENPIRYASPPPLTTLRISTPPPAPADWQKLKNRFEVETKVKKLREGKESDFFTLGKSFVLVPLTPPVLIAKLRDSDVFLSIVKGNSFSLMKWAAQPLWKFMKIKVARCCVADATGTAGVDR